MTENELCTLNDTRKENIELKQSCESLRDRNENLLNNERNLRDLIKTAAGERDGTLLALGALRKAIEIHGGMKLVKDLTRDAKRLANA